MMTFSKKKREEEKEKELFATINIRQVNLLYNIHNFL